MAIRRDDDEDELSGAGCVQVSGALSPAPPSSANVPTVVGVGMAERVCCEVLGEQRQSSCVQVQKTGAQNRRAMAG